MVEERRWWDREPIKLWAPLAAVAAALLQTAAYAGYQAFYGDFGVAADEVGFDYTTILRRTSVPIAMSLFVTLLIVPVAIVFLSFAYHLWKSSDSEERSRQLDQTYPGRAQWRLGILVAWVVLMLGCAWVTDGALTGCLLVLATLGCLAVDSIRAHTRREPSTLSIFLEPRPQHGTRHLLVLGAAMTLGFALPRWIYVPFVAVAIFWVDRALSRKTSASAPTFHERVRQLRLWPVSVTATLVMAFLSIGLVAQLDWAFRLADLEGKLQAVRSGEELTFEPFAPFGLIQPRAQWVTVSWVGPSPVPPPFADGEARRDRALMLFGQGSGTTVFYDDMSKVILRLPSGSVYMVTPAQRVTE